MLYLSTHFIVQILYSFMRYFQHFSSPFPAFIIISLCTHSHSSAKHWWHMKVWRFSQKQNLNFVSRQAFTSFKHGFFQVWGKCLPQSFPTPIGVTVLECPAILFGHICFSCLADVIANGCLAIIWQMLLPLVVIVADVKPLVL